MCCPVGADAHIGPIYKSNCQWADVGIGPYDKTLNNHKAKAPGGCHGACHYSVVYHAGSLSIAGQSSNIPVISSTLDISH